MNVPLRIRGSGVAPGGMDLGRTDEKSHKTFDDSSVAGEAGSHGLNGSAPEEWLCVAIEQHPEAIDSQRSADRDAEQVQR